MTNGTAIHPIGENDSVHELELVHSSPSAGRVSYTVSQVISDKPNSTSNPETVVSEPTNQFVSNQTATDSDSKNVTFESKIVGEHGSAAEPKPSEESQFVSTQVAVSSSDKPESPRNKFFGEELTKTIVFDASEKTASNSEEHEFKPAPNYTEQSHFLSSQLVISSAARPDASEPEFNGEIESTIESVPSQPITSTSEENQFFSTQIVTSSSTKEDESTTKAVPIHITTLELKPDDLESHVVSSHTSDSTKNIEASIGTFEEPSAIIDASRQSPEIFKSEEEKPGYYDALKNFVGGIMTSAIDAVTPQSPQSEPNFSKEENQIVSSIEATESSLGAEPPQAAERTMSSTILAVPSESTSSFATIENGDSKIISTTVTSQGPTIVEFSKSEMNDGSSSTIKVISSKSTSKSVHSSEIISSVGTSYSFDSIKPAIVGEIPSHITSSESNNGFKTVQITSSSTSTLPTTEVISTRILSEPAPDYDDNRVIVSETESDNPIFYDVNDSGFESTIKAVPSEPSSFSSCYDESHAISSKVTSKTTHIEQSSSSFGSVTKATSSELIKSKIEFD